MIAVTLLYPLILLKTRVQSSPRGTSPIHILTDILKTKGLGGLYKGLEVQLLKGVLNQGLTMMTKQR